MVAVMRGARAIFAVSVLLLAPVSAASAATTMVSPEDGESVSASPTFVFGGTVTPDYIEIETSQSPDTLTAGEDAGQFVARENFAPWFVPSTQALPISAKWDWRLPAGRLYWHGLAEVWGEGQKTWSPVRTIYVADEPAILSGWTLRADRIGPREGCARPVRLRGVIRWLDNDRKPRVKATLVVRAAGRLVGRAHLGTRTDDYTFDLAACTRARKLTVTPFLFDRGGSETRGVARSVTVHRPS